MMDIPLLRVFQAVTRHGTVTAAARHLGVTQSSVSYSLSRLRQHYGDPLFVRTGNRLAATPLAVSLTVEVDSVLAHLERIQLVAGPFDPAGSERVFRLYMLDLVEVMLLPGILKICQQEAPRVRVEIVRENAHMVRQQLESGGLDLAVGTPWEAEMGLHRSGLLEQRLVGIARQRHPVGKRLGTVEGFMSCRHCVIKPSGPIQVGIERAVAALPYKRQVALEVPGLLAVPEIVASTDLIAVVPEALVQHAKARLQVFEPPVLPLRFTVMLHWHARLHRESANHWLRQTVRRAAGHDGEA